MNANTPKIDNQLAQLKRLRAAPDKTLPIGYEEGQIPPTTANALQRAGIAVINGKVTDGKRTVTAK